MSSPAKRLANRSWRLGTLHMGALRMGALGMGLCVALANGGCGKKDEANCGAASARIIELLRTELTKEPDADRVKRARANLPTLQNSLLQNCESNGWSPSVRTCITTAQTAAQIRECDPAVQTPTAESAAPPEQSR